MSKKKEVLSSSKKKKLMKELGVNEEDIQRVYKKKKELKKQDDFTVYVPSNFGSLSNKFFGSYSNDLMGKKGSMFKHLAEEVSSSGMEILSKTYVSMILFSTFFGGLLFGILLATISILAKFDYPLSFLIGVVGMLVGGTIIFVIMYIYPSSLSSKKSREIKNDLPFAIIHMSAVAGSGAQPLSIFKLLLQSGEYKGLESEIKKIVNYVNLFGYSMTTTLKNVASRTPSKKFRDLLNGMSSTMESGGSLKSYLSSVADETMSSYKIERKKYIESLSTYSDIYTGVLIAAPLLFMVALAIINVLGGEIGGVPVATWAWGGTVIVLPIVNILFFLFLNMTQVSD